MRWERGEDPATWTTLDNAVIDDDLSCRALGLLTRWLRRPPGAELDSIPDMIKRSRQAGKRHLEGRDALYAASYELELAGYLVRELVSGSGGRHEWVVRIYARPVPPEKRSDPEDRKRGAKATTAGDEGRKRSAKAAPKRSSRSASSQVAPVTGFQESGFQEPGSPIPGNPDSENQASSIKNSHKDSLSGHSGHTSQGEERESGASRGNDNPDGVPRQRDEQASAPDAVGMVLTGWAAGAGLQRPPASVRGQLAGQVAELTDEYATSEELRVVAEFAGRRGWVDLGRAATHPDCKKLLAPVRPQRLRNVGGPEMCPHHPSRYRRGCTECALAVPA